MSCGCNSLQSGGRGKQRRFRRQTKKSNLRKRWRGDGGFFSSNDTQPSSTNNDVVESLENVSKKGTNIIADGLGKLGQLFFSGKTKIDEGTQEGKKLLDDAKAKGQYQMYKLQPYITSVKDKLHITTGGGKYRRRGGKTMKKKNSSKRVRYSRKH
jgi:hypothetical protein